MGLSPLFPLFSSENTTFTLGWAHYELLPINHFVKWYFLTKKEKLSCLAALEPLARLFPNRSGRHQQAFHREVERLPALSASFAYLQPGPQLLVGRVNHTLEVGRSPRRLLRWEGPSLFGTELYYSSNGLTHSAALSKNDQRPPFTL